MAVKTFTQPDLVEGAPFAVYAGVDCPAVGMADSESLERARRRLAYVEGRQVDYHVTQHIAAEGLALTDGTLLDVMMEAEELASTYYGGYATILLSKSMALCARSQELIQDSPGGGFVTVNGTRVGSVATVGPENVFLTGQITLIQGPVLDRIVPETVLPDGTCAVRRALAERIYVPLIECLMYAGTATCTSP